MWQDFGRELDAFQRYAETGQVELALVCVQNATRIIEFEAGGRRINIRTLYRIMPLNAEGMTNAEDDISDAIRAGNSEAAIERFIAFFNEIYWLREDVRRFFIAADPEAQAQVDEQLADAAREFEDPPVVDDPALSKD